MAAVLTVDSADLVESVVLALELVMREEGPGWGGGTF